MTDLRFDEFDALTFDCYGTLIDWEAGIAAGLRTVLEAHGVTASDDELLEAYAAHEAELEGGDYLPYREILGRSLRGVAADHGVTPTDAEVAGFSDSVGAWPEFADSPAALRELKRRFRLGVITNCDDDLFARSNERLGVDFDWIVTARQAGAYKPARRLFELALETIDVPRERILHVAQSLFHDHVTAKDFGLTTVWIDRRQGRRGSGATPPAHATPDLVSPDLASFARLAVA